MLVLVLVLVLLLADAHVSASESSERGSALGGAEECDCLRAQQAHLLRLHRWWPARPVHLLWGMAAGSWYGCECRACCATGMP